MGYQTDFYGKLEFTRHLTSDELATVEKILNADRMANRAMMEAVREAAEEMRRPGGPLIFNPQVGADIRAEMQGYIIRPDLSPQYASAMSITRDGTGLEYCSEKTYDLVAGVNFIIVNGRRLIPGFGLKGSLFADTEFEPHNWLLKIGADGLAYQEPCRMTMLARHSPKAYLRHLRWNWRHPSVW